MPDNIFTAAPEVFEAARTRRSIRAYKSDPVPRETLREIVGADWSDEIDAAWRKLLGDVERLVAAQ